jgi:hypothetical protein
MRKTHNRSVSCAQRELDNRPALRTPVAHHKHAGINAVQRDLYEHGGPAEL